MKIRRLFIIKNYIKNHEFHNDFLQKLNIMQAFFQRNLREDDIGYIGNNILKNFITCNLRCICIIPLCLGKQFKSNF